MEEKWLSWAKKIQSIAQAGLEYSKDKYDIERFQQLRQLSKEIMSQYTDLGEEKIQDLFCNEKGYQTPKVDVRAVVFKDNKILMAKEIIDGCWSLPGGWAEVDLSVKENAIKETKEETGMDVEPKRIIAVLDRNKNNPGLCPYGIYKIFVLCDLKGGNFVKNIETAEMGFFPLSNLPSLSLERNTRDQLEMCFKANYDKNFQAIFD